MLEVRAIMTPNPVTIGPDARIWEAANTMLDCQVSGLPVVDKAGELLGVISEGDFLRRGEIHSDRHHSFWQTLFASRGSLAEDYAKAFGKNVSEVMTSPCVSVPPDTSLERAATLMAEKNIKRLPVVDGNRIVGLVTRSDIMAAILRQLADHTAVKTDTDIQRALEAELAHKKWADSVSFEVHQGIVTLNGRVMDAREKTALRVAAENVTGVKGVNDKTELVTFPDMPVPPPGFYP